MSLFWADLAAFLGLLTLALPALQLNKLKRQQTRSLEKYASKDFEDDTVRALVAKAIARKRGEKTAQWRLRDQLCLYTGYALLLFSGGYRLLVGYII